MGEVLRFYNCIEQPFAQTFADFAVTRSLPELVQSPKDSEGQKTVKTGAPNPKP